MDVNAPSTPKNGAQPVSVSGYGERLVKFVESQQVTLEYSEELATAKGLFYGGKITLLSGMEPAEEF
jgi:hypothetical protein